MADKEKMVSAVALHYSVLCSLAELEQLRCGLHVAKVNELLEAYPEMFRPLFIHAPTKLTAQIVQDLYQVDFAEKGSNRRKKQEALMMNWITYLQDAEGIAKVIINWCPRKRL